MTTPTATVAVCTHNRSRVLNDCLASISTQTVDQSATEVLVVDNGSTDDTAPVVERWQSRLPGLRYLWSPTAGLSAARNLALESATGTVVAFLDDDARASPSWLEKLIEAHRDSETVAAGGPVVLSWESTPPPWMTPALEGSFSALDLGSSPRRLSRDEHLVGCNLSVVREHARRAGGFDEGLGRIGRRLRSGEDWRLLDVMRQSGGAVAYVPEAVVVHEVLRERARVWWLLRRSYEQGRTNSLYRPPNEPVMAPWSEARAATATAVRRLAGDVARWAARRPADKMVPTLFRRAAQIGYARECLSLAIRAGRCPKAPGVRSDEIEDR